MEKRNIYQKINAVMKEVAYIQKENKKVNNQYTFVSHDAVAAALHMPMAEHGIVMIPSVEELVQDGNRTMVKMRVNFINADDPADNVYVYQYGYGIDAQDKGIGKAVSYAVKYALLKVFCLETGDDVERDNINKSDDITVSPRLVENKKKWLKSFVGKEEEPKIEEFLQFTAKSFKKSDVEIVLGMTDKDAFLDSYQKWLESQKAA